MTVIKIIPSNAAPTHNFNDHNQKGEITDSRECENGTDALRSASLAIKNLFDDADHSVYSILLESFYFLKPDSRVSVNQTRTKYEDKNPLRDKPWDNLSY